MEVPDTGGHGDEPQEDRHEDEPHHSLGGRQHHLARRPDLTRVGPVPDPGRRGQLVPLRLLVLGFPDGDIRLQPVEHIARCGGGGERRRGAVDDRRRALGHGSRRGDDGCLDDDRRRDLDHGSRRGDDGCLDDDRRRALGHRGRPGDHRCLDFRHGALGLHRRWALGHRGGREGDRYLDEDRYGALGHRGRLGDHRRLDEGSDLGLDADVTGSGIAARLHRRRPVATAGISLRRDEEPQRAPVDGELQRRHRLPVGKRGGGAELEGRGAVPADGPPLAGFRSQERDPLGVDDHRQVADDGRPVGRGTFAGRRRPCGGSHSRARVIPSHALLRLAVAQPVTSASTS